jgi:hypothetical protein
MSSVAPTSKSDMTWRSQPKPITSVPFIAVLFFARSLASIAAVFSTDNAFDKDLKVKKI